LRQIVASHGPACSIGSPGADSARYALVHASWAMSSARSREDARAMLSTTPRWRA
jgi:hypothetical protein